MKIGDLLQNVYVINLDEDTVRWEKITEEFRRHGLAEPRRFPAIRATDQPSEHRQQIRAKRQNASSFKFDGHIGCAISHKALWNQALADGSTYVTVLEDDVMISPAFDALRDVELPLDWDFLYLGHVSLYAYLKNARSMVPQPPYTAPIALDNFYAFNGGDREPGAGYAYAFNVERMRDVIDAYDFQDHNDIYMSLWHGRKTFYGVYPSLFVHTYEYGSHVSPLNVTDPYRVCISYLTNYPRHLPFVIPWFLLLAAIIAYTRSILWAACWIAILGVRCLHDFKTLARKIDTARGRFSNVPGLFGVHYYDPFGDVWDDAGKQQLLNLLRSTHAICQESGIRYCLVYGTLLGWARHDKKVIPWDDDVDIGVDRRDLKQFIAKIQACPDLRLIKKFSIGCGFFYKIYSPNPNEIWPFIDVFPYDLDATETRITWSWGNWVAAINLPSSLRLLKSTFEGVNITVAEQWEAMLDAEYGSEWKEVCRSSTYCHRYEEELDPRYAATVESKYLGIESNVHKAGRTT